MSTQAAIQLGRLAKDLVVESLEGGCCGLAGSWGFESGRYDISMASRRHSWPAVSARRSECAAEPWIPSLHGSHGKETPS